MYLAKARVPISSLIPRAVRLPCSLSTFYTLALTALRLAKTLPLTLLEAQARAAHLLLLLLLTYFGFALELLACCLLFVEPSPVLQ